MNLPEDKLRCKECGNEATFIEEIRQKALIEQDHGMERYYQPCEIDSKVICEKCGSEKIDYRVHEGISYHKKAKRFQVLISSNSKTLFQKKRLSFDEGLTLLDLADMFFKCSSTPLFDNAELNYITPNLKPKKKPQLDQGFEICLTNR